MLASLPVLNPVLKQWQNLSSLLFLDRRLTGKSGSMYAKYAMYAMYAKNACQDAPLSEWTLRSLGQASLLEALLAHETPGMRGSDRHHSACIALSCFLLALPLPSIPTSFYSLLPAL